MILYTYFIYAYVHALTLSNFPPPSPKSEISKTPLTVTLSV